MPQAFAAAVEAVEATTPRKRPTLSTIKAVLMVVGYWVSMPHDNPGNGCASWTAIVTSGADTKRNANALRYSGAMALLITDSSGGGRDEVVVAVRAD